MSLILSGDTGLVFPAADVLALVKAVDGSGSGLEADTVPGYGIGVESAEITNAGLIVKSGMYKIAVGGGGPFGANKWLCLHQEYGNGSGAIQYGSNLTAPSYVQTRIRNSVGLWSQWNMVWTSDTDGPGSGLDADTVSGYGIGAAAKVVAGSAIDAIREGGFYTTNSAITNPPWAGENIYLLHINQGTIYSMQVAFRFSGNTTSDIATRVRVNSVWYSWNIEWSTANDGNGGQSPAPKPRYNTTDIGGANNLDYTNGTGADRTLYPNGTVTAGSSGETWFCHMFEFDTSGALHDSMCQVQAANAGLLVVHSGYRAVGSCWRVI